MPCLYADQSKPDSISIASDISQPLNGALGHFWQVVIAINAFAILSEISDSFTTH